MRIWDDFPWRMGMVKVDRYVGHKGYIVEQREDTKIFHPMGHESPI